MQNEQCNVIGGNTIVNINFVCKTKIQIYIENIDLFSCRLKFNMIDQIFKDKQIVKCDPISRFW